MVDLGLGNRKTEVFPRLPTMPEPLCITFGQIVRRRREAAALSQEELGEKTGVSRNYIGMIERGEANPTLLVVQQLSAALGCTMVSLVGELERA